MVEILEKKMTVQEFLQLDDFEEGFQYELINGEIVKKQSLSHEHQNALVNLSRIFSQFVLERKLGKIYIAPLDVYFTEIDFYQPDLFFLSNERLHLRTKDGIMGAPDLVIEILSPGTQRHDRNRKRKIYLQTGVQEYWIVDPLAKFIEVYNELDGDFDMTYFATSTGTVQSQVLAGLAVDIEEVFD